MRIPRELLPEIAQRHALGQSDQAIVRWLLEAHGITVSRIAVLQARRKNGASSAPPHAAASRPAAAAPAAVKPSGNQNRKKQWQQQLQEAVDQGERGVIRFDVPLEDDPKRAHLYELQVLLKAQDAINRDLLMTLPDKTRHTTAIAQAMGRIRAEAEWQKKLDQLETQLAELTEQLDAEQTENKQEARRLANLRLELEARRRALDEEHQKLAEARRVVDEERLKLRPPES